MIVTKRCPYIEEENLINYCDAGCRKISAKSFHTNQIFINHKQLECFEEAYFNVDFIVNIEPQSFYILGLRPGECRSYWRADKMRKY